MPHTEASWYAEIAAHSPQGSDYVELARFGNELFVCRAEVAEHFKEELEEWEALIKMNRLAVPLEQCCDEGSPLGEADAMQRLAGCPQEVRSQVVLFFQSASEEVRDYLVWFCFYLVQTERQRRTGSCTWRTEAPSGSPEVLKELMFKWGPRFRRHRWTW